MSNITHNDELVTKSDLAGFYQGIYPYLNGAAHAGFTPVGTVISVMGNTAPANYLACNGQIVNIADYKELADYFEAQFGTKNHFGGDGTTTFGIPDLRGEFLRGTGTNSHTGEGNGANVGTHQNGTTFPNIWSHTDSGDSDFRIALNNRLKNTANVSITYPDKSTLTRYIDHFSPSTRESLLEDTIPTSYKIRPTNTSVLYCIATKNIYIDARFDYSTDEKVVSTWIDGKPLYQRTFTGTISIPTDLTPTVITVIPSLSALSIDKIYKNETCVIGSDFVRYACDSWGGETNTKYFLAVVQRANDFVINTNRGTFNDALYRATLQYTKTTD